MDVRGEAAVTWTSSGQDYSSTLGVYTRVLKPDEYLGRQIWGLDAVGNWDASADQGTAQARTHNSANEITQIDGSSSLVSHDAAGNMTTVPHVVHGTACTHTYDAWNRLASCVDDRLQTGVKMIETASNCTGLCTASDTSISKVPLSSIVVPSSSSPGWPSSAAAWMGPGRRCFFLDFPCHPKGAR
jgi:hypothetical protein